MTAAVGPVLPVVVAVATALAVLIDSSTRRIRCRCVRTAPWIQEEQTYDGGLIESSGHP